MTRDLLGALQQAQEYDNEGLEVEIEDQRMYAFFEQVEDIREIITFISDNVEEVKKKQAEILSKTVNDTKIKYELDEQMDNISRAANKVRSELNSVEEATNNDHACDGADLRIRKTQHATISRRFVQVMTEYNKTQTAYRERCKLRIWRQLDIVGKHVGEADLEKMIECGNPAVFSQGIVDTMQNKEALMDIEARHNDIVKLEHSIRELEKMFLDMTMLVESQGEMVDRIDYNVENAKVYIHHAAVDTKKAVQYQKGSLKAKICVFVCGTILLIILISAIAWWIKHLNS